MKPSPGLTNSCSPQHRIFRSTVKLNALIEEKRYRTKEVHPIRQGCVLSNETAPSSCADVHLRLLNEQRLEGEEAFKIAAEKPERRTLRI